jgi:FKBP-type peptidyl-prolyl cis-trans isomerase
MPGNNRKGTGKVRLRLLATVSVALLLVSWACSESTGPKDIEELDFDPALGVNLSQMTETPSGLYYQDLVVGTGDAAVTGSTVTVHYTGWLHDGTKIDSSLDRGTPFTFPLGAGTVIAGWDLGVAGMKEGGKRKLVIPPNLGYGRNRYYDIPGNSTLVFDIELLVVE